MHIVQVFACLVAGFLYALLSGFLSSQQFQVQEARSASPRAFRVRAGASCPLRALGPAGRAPIFVLEGGEMSQMLMDLH